MYTTLTLQIVVKKQKRKKVICIILYTKASRLCHCPPSSFSKPHGYSVHRDARRAFEDYIVQIPAASSMLSFSTRSDTSTVKHTHSQGRVKCGQVGRITSRLVMSRDSVTGGPIEPKQPVSRWNDSEECRRQRRGVSLVHRAEYAEA